MATLLEYLANLNSCETTWEVYVNPENLDDFRIGQSIFEEGGLLDGKVSIGTLENSSFGFQSETDIIKELIANEQITYRDTTFTTENVYLDGFIGAYFENRLDSPLQKLVEELIEETRYDWARDASSLKIEELEEYFNKEDGEYWQELRECV